MQSLLAVSTGLSVELFAAEKGIGPILSLASGITNPIGAVAYDASGNLYVATNSSPQSGQAVLEYAPGATIPFRKITTGVGEPIKLQVDPAGNLFVLNVGYESSGFGTGGWVAEYAPNATTPESKISVSYPTDFVVDASDDIWVASVSHDYIAYFAKGSSSGVSLTGFTRPVGMALDRGTKTLYVSDQTNFTVSNQAGCGSDGTPATFCQILAYAFNATSPTVYSSKSYGGDLYYLPNVGLFADTATGPEYAWYPSYSTPPVTPLAWTGNLNGRGSQGIAVDELGNPFVAVPTKGSVYGFLSTAIIYGGSVAPNITLTNGLTYPYNLAIVP
jgi:hypothetical protein